MSSIARPIVFLHIPKTAGQTIHTELVKLVGGQQHVSPVRVHTQAAPDGQMPAGYRLYSGHIDWTGIDSLPQDRFAFTVLRDPKERIASFYFYLRKEAQQLSAADLARPENLGKRKALEESADDYFFGGDQAWRNFILDHYDNFYCSYFATRRMRGRQNLSGLGTPEIMARAHAALAGLQGVYLTDRLDRLEDDIERNFGARISVTGTYVNAGNHRADEKRWPKLAATLERDSSLALLEGFAYRDETLMAKAEYLLQPA